VRFIIPCYLRLPVSINSINTISCLFIHYIGVSTLLSILNVLRCFWISFLSKRVYPVKNLQVLFLSLLLKSPCFTQCIQRTVLCFCCHFLKYLIENLCAKQFWNCAVIQLRGKWEESKKERRNSWESFPISFLISFP
jgi:hypothetical protein